MRPLKTPRSIAHDDRLTMVGHLDELRTRIIVSLIALAVAFGVCFWQNHRLLTLIDSPLRATTLPRRQPPSAVMTSFASASLMRPASASAENPPKTTVCGAPMRAQASIAIGSSGIIGM